MRQIFFVLMIVSFTFTISCSKSKPFDREDQADVKILILCCKEQFQQRYLDHFQKEYPFVNFEIISADTLIDTDQDYYEQVQAVVETEQPDVIQLSSSPFEELARKGELLSLAPYIQRDRLDLDNIHPSVIDNLNKLGGGELYGLSPYFLNYAIYYNKDIFNRLGVEPPTDQMSWEELFRLAGRISQSSGESIYGFYAYDPLSLFKQVGITAGLQEFDEAGNKSFLTSEEWKKAWRLVAENQKEGTIWSDLDYSIEIEDRFINGTAAMTLSHYSYSQEMARNDATFDWGVVTAPVDPNNRDKGAFFGLYDIFSIHRDSTNKEAAWAFVRYVNGEQYAKEVSMSTVQLLSRTEHIQDNEGRNISAFYKLAPSDYGFFSNRIPISNQLYVEYNQTIQEQLSLAINGQKETMEALEDAYEQIQLLLDAEE